MDMSSPLCNTFRQSYGHVRTVTRELCTQDALERANFVAKAKRVNETLGHDDLSVYVVDPATLGVAREVLQWRVAWLLKRRWRASASA